MKRAELERWLRSHGVEPVPGRGRGGHDPWRHAETGAKSFVPRHREIGVGALERSAGSSASRRSRSAENGQTRSVGVPLKEHQLRRSRRYEAGDRRGSVTRVAQSFSPPHPTSDTPDQGAGSSCRRGSTMRPAQLQFAEAVDATCSTTYRQGELRQLRRSSARETQDQQEEGAVEDHQLQYLAITRLGAPAGGRASLPLLAGQHAGADCAREEGAVRADQRASAAFRTRAGREGLPQGRRGLAGSGVRAEDLHVQWAVAQRTPGGSSPQAELVVVEPIAFGG